MEKTTKLLLICIFFASILDALTTHISITILGFGEKNYWVFKLISINPNLVFVFPLIVLGFFSLAIPIDYVTNELKKAGYFVACETINFLMQIFMLGTLLHISLYGAVNNTILIFQSFG